MHVVLGIEREVEPLAAIGNHAGGVEILARRMGLALVVVEKHARAAVHLADDDALGAVVDEGALVGHERHVAHVDILLLDIEHRLGLGVGIDRSEEHTSELQSLMRISYAAFCLKNKNKE